MSLTTISGEIQTQPLNDNFSYLNQRKNDLGLNVKDYGAVGDGITNDTISIQAALTVANLDFRGIFFPKGTYIVTATLTLGGNVHLYGEGISNTIIKLANNANCDIITVPNDGTLRYWTQISNIGFDGNATNQTSGHCISLYNASEFIIRDVRIVSPKQNAILVNGATSILPMLSNLIIRADSAGNTVGNGIELQFGSSDLVISDCDIGWFSQGVGLLLSQCEGSEINNVMCWQNKYGFQIYDSDRIRMSNCLADESKQYGYYIQLSDTVQITNCQAKDSSMTAANTYDGFIIQGDSANNTVKVVMNNCISYGSQTRYGLAIDQYVDNIKVTNCDFNNNPSGKIYRGATGLSNISIDTFSYRYGNSIASHDYLAGTADWTVTYEEFASDILNCYNASAAVFAYLPTEYKNITVRNSTGFNLTVRAVGTVTGGVTFSTGSSKLVFYNGSNYETLA